MQWTVCWKGLWFSCPHLLTESICGASFCHHKNTNFTRGLQQSVKKRVGNLTRIRLFLPFRLIHTNFYNSRTNDCISSLIWFQKNWIIRHTSLYAWAWCVTWVSCLHLFPFTEVWAWVTGTAFPASSGRQPSTLLTPLQLALERVSRSMPSWGWNYPISRRGNF